MPAVEYIRSGPAMAYTGSNGAEMAAFVNAQIVSDTGTHLNLGNPETSEVTMSFGVGDFWDKTEGGIWMGADHNANHITKASALQDTIFNPAGLQSQITANTNSITAMLVPTMISILKNVENRSFPRRWEKRVGSKIRPRGRCAA